MSHLVRDFFVDAQKNKTILFNENKRKKSNKNTNAYKLKLKMKQKNTLSNKNTLKKRVEHKTLTIMSHLGRNFP